uniref:Uncharacterized protein n=1 Tax=Rhizophora mucronata TaxID=61149 RepID=A0A2P2QPT7_RHIMU
MRSMKKSCRIDITVKKKKHNKLLNDIFLACFWSINVKLETSKKWQQMKFRSPVSEICA